MTRLGSPSGLPAHSLDLRRLLLVGVGLPVVVATVTYLLPRGASKTISYRFHHQEAFGHTACRPPARIFHTLVEKSAEGRFCSVGWRVESSIGSSTLPSSRHAAAAPAFTASKSLLRWAMDLKNS